MNRAKMQQAGDPLAREGNTTGPDDPKIIKSDCTTPGAAGQENTGQFLELPRGGNPKLLSDVLQWTYPVGFVDKGDI